MKQRPAVRNTVQCNVWRGCTYLHHEPSTVAAASIAHQHFRIIIIENPPLAHLASSSPVREPRNQGQVIVKWTLTSPPTTGTESLSAHGLHPRPAAHTSHTPSQKRSSAPVRHPLQRQWSAQAGAAPTASAVIWMETEDVNGIRTLVVVLSSMGCERARSRTMRRSSRTSIMLCPKSRSGKTKRAARERDR